MPLTETDLKAFLGKHIRDVCPNGYADDSDNHCAHFVSHVLGYQFGATCRMMKGGTGAAACLRVQEVLPKCLQIGNWADLPTPLFWGLVFTTKASNVNIQKKTMANVPRKHIGIFIGGARSIYHYSNKRRQVIVETPEQFSKHYDAPDNAMFWGSAP